MVKYFVGVFIVVLIATAQMVVAQGRVALSYFDLGELRDTVQSPFHFDKEDTPRGRNRWTQQRYEARIAGVTAVIDSMALPIVVLYGVENEGVVRDIVMASSEDYCYLHRELDYYDGLDFALLFYGDRLFVEEVVVGGAWLYVLGEISGQRVAITLVRLASRISAESPPWAGAEADVMLIMGRLSSDDLQSFGATDLLAGAASRGEGNTLGDRGWYFNSGVALLTDAEGARAGG
ncbi:MAG: hypothetical protein R3Y68_05090 [Rikenellaceae bacterium]